MTQQSLWITMWCGLLLVSISICEYASSFPSSHLQTTCIQIFWLQNFKVGPIDSSGRISSVLLSSDCTLVTFTSSWFVIFRAAQFLCNCFVVWILRISVALNMHWLGLGMPNCLHWWQVWKASEGLNGCICSCSQTSLIALFGILPSSGRLEGGGVLWPRPYPVIKATN